MALPELTDDERSLIERLKAKGISFEGLEHQEMWHDKTYHYLPYHFDSGFEKSIFSCFLLQMINRHGIEAYYNGDNSLTEFKIDCYKQDGGNWLYIGKYTPDFLLIKRSGEGKIDRMLIVETKGGVYESKFLDRLKFMEDEFLRLNNGVKGFPRFSFLYMKDTDTEDGRAAELGKAVSDFFDN